MTGNAATVEDFLTLSAHCVKAGAIDDAIATLRAAQEAAPRHLGVRSNLGGLLARQGRHDEALDLLRGVLRETPRSPIAHYNLAVGLRAAGDPGAAVRHFEQTLAARPNSAEALRGLGDALLDLDRLADAAAAYERSVRLRRHPSHAASTRIFSHRSKLRHDAEQFRYLVAKGLLGAEFRDVAAAYERAGDFLMEPGLGAPPQELPDKLAALVAPTYDRLHYRPACDAEPDGALDPDLDVGRIEAEYLAGGRGIAWFDRLLKPSALARLLAFARESTVWFHARYGNGYVGAFLEDGFCCPLLIQIAGELREALPRILGRHQLRRLWAFKYDSRPGGIPIHADAAAVNVNFWLTPDAANRDPDGGGLVVWDKRAPEDCDFGRFVKDEAAIRERLREAGAKAVNVPYRQNRAVMFNSDLYHETGALDFHGGYENRRINVTMLYGVREG